MTMMSYKSYEAVVEYDEDADIFHGEVINMRDVITFQGKSVSELKRAFAASVEDYLAFCKQRAKNRKNHFPVSSSSAPSRRCTKRCSRPPNAPD
jgi:predicted HicB family RNase H-like nuclease